MKLKDFIEFLKTIPQQDYNINIIDHRFCWEDITVEVDEESKEICIW